jgi:nucleotide-binding universal stress UspA family protein
MFRRETVVIEFRRVLCAVDLSEVSVRALAYAGAIATWYGARLTALHVVPTFEPVEVRAGALFDPVRILQPMPREEVLERLGEALEAAGIAPGEATAAAGAGPAAETIVDQAVAGNADLLVMGTHGRSGFDRLLLGSVAEKVLRRASCPVLTVPPHAPASSTAQVTLRHIVCPVDFSPAALQAVGFALDLARRAKATVTMLHAIEWLAEEEPRELVHFNVPEFRRHLTESAHERLAALLGQEPAWQGVAEPLVAVGRAYREILRVAAEQGAELIVMGARGRGEPELTTFGSTTQQVVRAASCPVLTVHRTA